MERRADDEITDWLNLVPAAAVALLWLAPMVLFWGIVFGHLRPKEMPRIDRSPNIYHFFFWCGLSLCPYALPRSYYNTRNATRTRRLYESLGVRFFKRFVANGELVNRCARRHGTQIQVTLVRGDIASFVERTRGVEQAHLVLLLLGLFTAGYATWIGWYAWTACLILGNGVCNVYPVLLQRYHRARVSAMADVRTHSLCRDADVECGSPPNMV